MSTRGQEPASTWNLEPTGMSRMDRPDGAGRRLDRQMPAHLPSDDAAADGRTLAELRELTRGTVRTALRAERRGAEMEGEVLQLLRLTCAVARASGDPVERVLILLKEAWREQPEARPRRYSDAEDTLARVITLCIDEYYTPSRST